MTTKRTRKPFVYPRIPWVIYMASVLHIAWGIGALLDPHVHNNSFLFEIAVIGGHKSWCTAGIFIVVGVIPLIARWFFHTRLLLGVALSIPQQYVVMLSAWGFVYNMIVSSVPEVNGTIPRGAIYPAAVLAVTLAVFHTAAIFYTYILPVGIPWNKLFRLRR